MEKQNVPISGLLAEQIDFPVSAEEAYERSERSALDLLEAGFHLSGASPPAGMSCMNAKIFVDRVRVENLFFQPV